MFQPRPQALLLPRDQNSANKKFRVNRVGNFSGQNLGRVGKPETHIYFFWPNETNVD